MCAQVVQQCRRSLRHISIFPGGIYIMGLKQFICILFTMYVGTMVCDGFEHSMDVDPIDSCIITCSECFDDNLLLKCANDCIRMDGKVSPLWKLTCPYFGDYPMVQKV